MKEVINQYKQASESLKNFIEEWVKYFSDAIDALLNKQSNIVPSDAEINLNLLNMTTLSEQNSPKNYSFFAIMPRFSIQSC